MGKKQQIIFAYLLLLLVILTFQMKRTPDIVSVKHINSENTTIDNKTTTEKEKTENSTTTEEQNPLLNLTFDSGVSIDDYIRLDNAYVAIGEKNHYPYMQMIYVENNQIIKKGLPYVFTDSVGKITNIKTNGYFITTTVENETSIYTQDFIEYNDEFIPFYKKQIQYNYNEGITIEPEYLVIHETANTAVGADANAHYRYWNNNPTAYASTHFVVDSNEIYQMLELNQSAWHVGDNDGHSDITNLNSIGIEVAVNADGDFSAARQNAINLTINIMNTLDMDISQLKRHYDASGKYCPTNMLQEPELWTDFVNQVEDGLE